MTIQLDHRLVTCGDRRASAKLPAKLFGAAWAETGVGPFSPVIANNGLTHDFEVTDATFPVQQYCLRVSAEVLDAIHDRIKAAKIIYCGNPHV